MTAAAYWRYCTQVSGYNDASSGVAADEEVLLKGRETVDTGVNEPGIVDYDPSWPAVFALERQALFSALPPVVTSVEHIGSTAVPGLDGRPLIDIMLSVQDAPSAAWLDEPLALIDYYRIRGRVDGLCEAVYRRGEVFALWIVVHGSEAWKTHLEFRDQLRSQSSSFWQYSTLKRRAMRAPESETVYEAEKRSFIEDTLGRSGES
jgi:GrpB-like predicted nucleotidyltransferase (UPF0157 family)